MSMPGGVSLTYIIHVQEEFAILCRAGCLTNVSLLHHLCETQWRGLCWLVMLQLLGSLGSLCMRTAVMQYVKMQSHL